MGLWEIVFQALAGANMGVLIPLLISQVRWASPNIRTQTASSIMLKNGTVRLVNMSLCITSTSRMDANIDYADHGDTSIIANTGRMDENIDYADHGDNSSIV